MEGSKGLISLGSWQEEEEKKEGKEGAEISRLTVAGLAAANLSPTPRLGPPRLGSPDRQSPPVSAEAENQAPAPTASDSAPFSRRLPARGSFPIGHKTNSSVSLRGLLPVPPPSSSSPGRRLSALPQPPEPHLPLPYRPHIGEDLPKFYSTQAPLRSTIQLSSPHVEISIVLWRSFRIREKRYLLPTKADPPPPRSLPATLNPSYLFTNSLPSSPAATTTTFSHNHHPPPPFPLDPGRFRPTLRAPERRTIATAKRRTFVSLPRARILMHGNESAATSPTSSRRRV